MDNEKIVYKVVTEDDSSLKQFFDRFYVVPKDRVEITDSDRSIIEKHSIHLLNDDVANGLNGYIVFRGKKPKKLNSIQLGEILADTVSTQRELAFKYNVGVATINKIKKGIY